MWNQTRPPETALNPWGGNKIVGVNGTSLHIQGSANVTITVMNKTFRCTMVIVDDMTVDAILGLDFLETNHCTINIGDKLLQIPACKSFIPVNGSTHCDTSTPTYAILAATELIPAYSEMEVMTYISNNCLEKLHVVETIENKTNIMAARALVYPTADTIPVQILKPSSEAKTLYKGTKIATIEQTATIEEDKDSVAVISTVSCQTKPNLKTALWDIVNRSDTELNKTQQQSLYQLLLQYTDIFATGQHNLGHTTVIKHQIDTGNVPPICQQARRVPPVHRQEAKQLLNDMLDSNIITPSSSPWASPVVFVRKKDSSLRFCVHYHKVNVITRKDAYPLPRVDDILDTLACCKWFTTLDLLSGYWQVEVDVKDREKTAFTTPDGLFEFTRMPFGLCNAPATFQRLMDLVLAGLQWNNCLVYLSDILIIGKAFDDHLHNLNFVFDRIRGAGLKLKPSKCAICRKQVTYLSHIVSANGISTDPTKINKVKDWPIPTCKRQVQQFLGLVSY